MNARSETRVSRVNATAFATHPFGIGGHAVVADRSGALYWPQEKTLIVADLHLEKGSAFAMRGRMLPPYDTRETIARLAEAIGRYLPARVIALGDSLHDRGAEARIEPDDLRALHALQSGRDWVWVTGNHDPQISRAMGGRVVDSLESNDGHPPLSLRHAPCDAAVLEIAGHLHPAARLGGRRQSLRRPCFIASARRLVMPAFGAFTGGLNVRDDAFKPFFGDDAIRVCMLGRDGVYPVPFEHLLAD